MSSLIEVDSIKKRSVYVKPRADSFTHHPSRKLLYFPTHDKLVYSSGGIYIEILDVKRFRIEKIFKMQYGEVNDLCKFDDRTFICCCKERIVSFSFSKDKKEFKVEKKFDTESAPISLLKIDDCFLVFQETKCIMFNYYTNLVIGSWTAENIGFGYDGFDYLSNPTMSKLCDDCCFVSLFFEDIDEETSKKYHIYSIVMFSFVKGEPRKKFGCCEESRDFHFTTFLDSDGREILVYGTLYDHFKRVIEFYDTTSSTFVKKIVVEPSSCFMSISKKYLFMGDLNNFHIINLFSLEKEKTEVQSLFDGNQDINGRFLMNKKKLGISSLELHSLGKFSLQGFARYRILGVQKEVIEFFRVSGLSVLHNIELLEKKDLEERREYVVNNFDEYSGIEKHIFVVKLLNTSVEINKSLFF